MHSARAFLGMLPFFMFAATSVTVMAEPVSYSGHSKARVFVQSMDQIQWLIDQGIDVWSHEAANGTVDVRLAPGQGDVLAAGGLKFEVLVPDLGPQVEAERTRLMANRAKRGEGFDYLDFHPYEVIVDYINALQAAYPDFVEVMDFGLTIENRTVWGLKLTSPGGLADKHAFLFYATEHAREWLTTPVPLFTADYLLQNYGTDPRATSLLDRVEWYIIPVMNPDGYVYTWDFERYWRKNRRDNAGSSFGVDLNRNWLHEWGGSGSSGDPFSDTYRGTAPLSEPETQNMYNFLLNHPNVRAHMDMHSYGELIMWPWAYTSQLCPDDAALREVGMAMDDALKGVHGNDYTSGPVGATLYLAAGASLDTVYTLADPFIYSFTIEVRGFDFVVPPTEILPNAEENLQAILALVENTTGTFDFVLPAGAPFLVSPTTPTSFEVRVDPIAESVVPGTEFLYYRTSVNDDFTAVSLVSTGENSYEATIPILACSANPQFYLSAMSSGGSLVTSPLGAPFEVYEASVGDVDPFTVDDFESDLGWSVSGDAVSGEWQRGVPAGDGTRGDPTSDFDGSGQCYLTQNASGNTDVDNGSTTLSSPVFDLTGLADPHVGYARWYYNNGGPAPQSEVFLVEVSDDGGQTWVVLETVGPTGDEVVGGWFLKDFNIANHVEVTDQFSIRFTAADTGQGTNVEAAIDAFSVYQVVCESSGCEGDVNGDNTVDPLDSGYVIARFGCSVGTGDNECDAADANLDGVVDPLDAGFVQSRFGACP